MSSVLPAGAPVQPTNAAPLPRLFAYTTGLGLERFLDRRKRGLSALVLSLVWLVSSEVEVDGEAENADVKVVQPAAAVEDSRRVTGGRDVTADGTESDPASAQAWQEPTPDRRGARPQSDHHCAGPNRAG